MSLCSSCCCCCSRVCRSCSRRFFSSLRFDTSALSAALLASYSLSHSVIQPIASAYPQIQEEGVSRAGKGARRMFKFILSTCTHLPLLLPINDRSLHSLPVVWPLVWSVLGCPRVAPTRDASPPPPTLLTHQERHTHAHKESLVPS